MTQIPLFSKVGCSGTPQCCAGMQQTFQWELWDCHLVLVPPGAIHPNPYPNPRLPHPTRFQPRHKAGLHSVQPLGSPQEDACRKQGCLQHLGWAGTARGPIVLSLPPPPPKPPAQGQGGMKEAGGMKEVGSAASPPRVIKGESAARGWLLFIS